MLKPIILVISYNRVTYLKQFIKRMEELSINDNLIIVDNASTYEPLLQFYTEIKYPIHRLTTNHGYNVICSLWPEFKNKYSLDQHDYIISDPDIIPIRDCPSDFIDYFKSVLDKYEWCERVGFGLKIDNLPPGKDGDINNQFYKQILKDQIPMHNDKLEDGVYKSAIDTTLSLRKKNMLPINNINSIRCGYPYMAKHLSWYLDLNNLDDETKYYLNSINNTHSYSLQQKKMLVTK